MLYRDNYCANLRKAFGFECRLLSPFGKYEKCYALNAYQFGSQQFGELMKTYDILVAFIYDGEKTTVSLYTEKPDVDVSAIAKEFGGGGHKGAAGFVVDGANMQWLERI